jgi:dienelactone hydrolase
MRPLRNCDSISGCSRIASWAAIDWARAHPQTSPLPIGFFGASTGAAAALLAAARRSDAIRAVVSRGGRPDLAGDALETVVAPTLLIVGGRDDVVIELNRQALARMTVEKALQVVPGATHLFEESGALDQVAALARDWFGRHLT